MPQTAVLINFADHCGTVLVIDLLLIKAIQSYHQHHPYNIDLHDFLFAANVNISHSCQTVNDHGDRKPIIFDTYQWRSHSSASCVEIVAIKLRNFIEHGPWTIPAPFENWFTPSPSCAPTEIDIHGPWATSSPCINVNQRLSAKRKYVCCNNGIASRLPARSRATIHCRSRYSIASRLAPRYANPRTLGRIVGIIKLR